MCVRERERGGGGGRERELERNKRGVKYISTCRYRAHTLDYYVLDASVKAVSVTYHLDTGNGTCSCLFELHSVLTLADASPTVL